MRVDIPVGLCCSEPVSYAAVEEDGTSGLAIEVFDDLDTVGADVLLLHGCQQSFMPNPVEGFLEVYEDTVEVFLMLVFFSDDLLHLWLQSVQYDLQHDCLGD